MKSFVVYDNAGYIKRYGRCQDALLDAQASADESVIAVPSLDKISGETHYVDLATKTVKPKQDYTLATLPIPCTVIIDGITYNVTSQPTFNFTVPGTYVIKVQAGSQYLEKEFVYDYQP